MKDLNKKEINKNSMGKRRLINGKYYEARERTTSAGQKGTIKGKWKPNLQKKPKTLREYILGK